MALATRRTAVRRRRTSLTGIVIRWGVFGVMAIVLFWTLGGEGINAYAATHGHGVAGTFEATHEECHTSKSGRHCEWHGTFEADDRSVLLDDVQMDAAGYGATEHGWYAHVVPGSTGKVFKGGASDWLVPGTIGFLPLVAYVVAVSIALVGKARKRRASRGDDAGRGAGGPKAPRTPKVPRKAGTSRTDDQSVPGMIRY